MTDQAVTSGVFRMGDVLGRGFSIFFKNIIPFMLLSFLIYSPIIVYTALIDTSYDNPNLLDTIQTWGIVVVALAIPLSMLVTATLVYGTFQELRGQRVSIVACVIHGIGRIFPVLIITVLVTICILAGTIALIIPGLIVATMLWVAIPVAVVERPGIVPSLKRSAELTSGYRWPIFGIIVLFSILDKVTEFIAENMFIENITVYLISVMVLAAFFTALESVVTAVGYHDLRVAKEGVDIEQLAAVFD